jgi:hypothetical protein
LNTSPKPAHTTRKRNAQKNAARTGAATGKTSGDAVEITLGVLRSICDPNSQTALGVGVAGSLDSHLINQRKLVHVVPVVSPHGRSGIRVRTLRREVQQLVVYVDVAWRIDKR